MWVTYVFSSIRSITHLSLYLFTYGLNWECCHEGVSISTGSITSSLYTMVKGVSLVVELGVVWHDYNIWWSNSKHNPLASSHFFFIPFRITLFVDSACPLDWGWTTYRTLVVLLSYDIIVTVVMENWVPLSDMMMLGNPNMHMIFSRRYGKLFLP